MVARQVWQSRELVWYLVYSDLKSTFNSRVLGFLWSILDPVLMMGVYFLLIGVVFNRGGPRYLPLLLVALLFWRCLTSSLVSSVTSISGKAELVQSIDFPKVVLPLAKVVLRFVELGLGLLVLFPVLAVSQARVTWHLLWLPCLLAVEFVLCVGLALLFAVVGVYFRDFQSILQYLLRISFYLSPVLYSVGDRVPERFRVAYMMNPFAGLLESCKSVFVLGESVSPYLGWTAALALFFMIVGAIVFRKAESNMARYV